MPRVWVLTGHRSGDNAQVEALAEALGWPWETRRLSWRRRPVGWTPLYGRRRPSLAPLSLSSREEITPPWPDLVLSVGWRSVPVARWIGQRSGARLVHLGRPRAPLGVFDLVLTTPQYALPDAPNLVRLSGPLSRLSPERLARAAELWRGRLGHLPTPRIAVLVGGDAPPLRLTEDAARELGARADALARRRGGSLLIATGPRTGRAAAEALLAEVTVPAHRYVWGEGGENPYAAYLALADEIVFTGDSVSMAQEAALTGRPLHLFELPARGGWPGAALRRLDRHLRHRPGAIGRGYLELIRDGWIAPPRQREAVHSRLLASGRAVPLGASATPSAGLGVAGAGADTERAADAVRRLFATSAGPAPEDVRRPV